MNLDDYRITYKVAGWERIAETHGQMCVPLGAVRAISALCDEVERLTQQRDDLLAALKEYIAATEYGVNPSDDDDISAMLRFGEAGKAARTAIANQSTTNKETA